MLQAYFPFGEIVKPQGVRGEVKVLPDTSYPEHMAKLKKVFRRNGDSFTALTVLKGRVQDSCIYYYLEGITDRNAAEELRGTELYVAREDNVPLEEGENYIGDLEGCTVLTEDGQTVGTLLSITHPGRQDLFTVETTEKKTLIFPRIPGLVLQADPAANRITVHAKTLSEVSLLED